MIKQISFNKNSLNIWSKIAQQNSIKIPFFDYHWHRIWFEVLADHWQPMILLVNEDIIAPFARKNNQIIFSGGYDVADYLDIIGPNEKKLFAWKEIVAYLRKHHMSKINLNNIPQSSPTIRYFQDKGKIDQEDTTPIIKLPSTWNEYLYQLKYKYRHELRRKLRKFKLEFPHVEIETCSPSHQTYQQFMQLMRLNPVKNQFLTPQMEIFFQQIIFQFKKEIKFLLLKLNHHPISATLSFVSPTHEYLYNSGFNKRNFPGAGFYLKANAIKLAITRGIKEYNFLQGDERYKYELGGRDFLVYRVKITV